MRTTTIIAGIVAAAVSVISTASAVQMNTSASGTMLTVNPAGQQYIFRGPTGVWNTDTATRLVHGSISRNPQSSGDQEVCWTAYSDSRNNVNYGCIYAQHAGGGYSGKCVETTGVLGIFEQCVTFGVAEAPVDSAYDAFFRLLPAQANRIISYRVSP